MSGPLEGYRIVEIAGIGPGPYCAMLLADLGADIVRVDRSAAVRGRDPDRPSRDVLGRGRRSVGVDLKSADGAAVVLDLASTADALIEGFRPGVAERLGIGPDKCLARNPRLVYGRMTGWGQDGPMAQEAGHDINYISLAGALWHFGRRGEPPVPPLNLVGDFGGGGMLLALGVVSALLEAQRSGQGQVIDAAMVDGAASLMTMMYSARAGGGWVDERGANALDTGAYFYEVYECSDGQYLSVGALEPQFYAQLLRRVGLEQGDFPRQHDRREWPAMKDRFAALFQTRTRDEWCELLAGADACVAPVLSMAEAPEHPHNQHRETFVNSYGVTQPAPAPRFSRTPGTIRRPPPHPGQHTDEVLGEWLAWDADRIAKVRSTGAVA